MVVCGGGIDQHLFGLVQTYTVEFVVQGVLPQYLFVVKVYDPFGQVEFLGQLIWALFLRLYNSN